MLIVAIIVNLIIIISITIKNKNKRLFKIDDIDINKILVSKKESYGEKNSLKYFIGYNDDDVIRPLRIKLSKMIGYVKHFDSNKASLLWLVITNC